jgi:hypothetical protein
MLYKASRALICFPWGTQPNVRSVGQGAQVNSAVLGDGKVFMRCTSDILGGVLARPTADYVAQGREGGLLGYE